MRNFVLSNFFSLHLLFTIPNARLYNPRDVRRTIQMPVGQMTVREHRLWTGTLDMYIRSGLPESVVSRISGSPQEKTQDKTQTTHIQSQERLKSLIPPGIEPGTPR